MEEIPDSHVDLLEGTSVADFATVMPDGTPHVTPVWVGHDGDEVLVNTSTGRRKTRNVERNPRVGLSVVDSEDPYRYLSVQGRATLETEGAVEHIHELSRRYTGEDYSNLDGEEGHRVVVRVEPSRVIASG